MGPEKVVETAKLIIVNPLWNFLLMRRRLTDHARPGQFDFIGGEVESGESPFTAVLREAEEEAGFEASNINVYGLFTDERRSSYGHLNKRHFFLGVVAEVDPVLSLGSEHDLSIWAGGIAAQQMIEHPVQQLAVQRALAAVPHIDQLVRAS